MIFLKKTAYDCNVQSEIPGFYFKFFFRSNCSIKFKLLKSVHDSYIFCRPGSFYSKLPFCSYELGTKFKLLKAKRTLNYWYFSD